MEEENEDFYEVKFTKLSKQHFEELLAHFYGLYPVKRTENIANSLIEKAFSLSRLPLRGRIEENLKNESHEYRFIIFQRTKRADIKILYRVDEIAKTVYLLDFFPTEMDVMNLTGRIS